MNGDTWLKTGNPWEKMKIKVERSYLDNCTIGKLYVNGVHEMYTVERPWLSNQKNISCIPAGRYRIGRHNTASHPDCFYLENYELGVSHADSTQRRFILFHSANFAKELEGCIAPGMDLHPEKWGVYRSREAMKVLRQLIENIDEWEVEIV